MKVGMIFECAPNGPDYQVCKYLAERLVPDIVIEAATLTNKQYLIEKCGVSAATLLAQGCDRVIVVWDLYPPWATRARPCLKKDRDAILSSLSVAGVDLQHVHLVCIIQELEAWLLADERAIAAVLSPRTGSIRRHRRPETVTDPKVRLDSLFREHRRGPYQAHRHAIQIVKNMTTLDRLDGCSSFIRFVEKVTGRTGAM